MSLNGIELQTVIPEGYAGVPLTVGSPKSQSANDITPAGSWDQADQALSEAACSQL